MITLNDYLMGRDKKFPELVTEELKSNALVTIERANKFLILAKGAGVTISSQAPIVSSGWRPPAINANTKGASLTSHHMTGCAIDLFDPDGYLDKWAIANLNVLKDLELWLEHPDATPRWCHLQTKPPKSGNRVFKP